MCDLLPPLRVSCSLFCRTVCLYLSSRMVVCAVKLCRNYTGKNIKQPEGISFHRFPTDLDEKQQWIQAILREPDWIPGTHCRVCSVHFEISDFKISETGQRILHKYAVPTKNLYQEESSETQTKRILKKRRSTRSKGPTRPDLASEEILACRVCLAIDTRLYNVHDCEMVQPLTDLTGCVVSPTDGLPQQICNICYTLLQKYSEFRARCETSQVLLENAHSEKHMITTDDIRNMDRMLHCLNLSVKRQPIIDITEINIKQEKIDLILEEDSNIDSSHTIDDAYDIFDEKDDQKFDVKIENDLVLDNFDSRYATVIPKNEIFVAVDARKILDNESSTNKKRKSELKSKCKKLKKEAIVKDIRNIKARKTDEDYDKFAKMYSVDITFLTSEDQIAEVQAKKESDNYKHSSFKCDELFKGSTGESAFKNHKAIHDSAVKSRCDSCNVQFHSEAALGKHIDTSPDNLCQPGTRACAQCGDNFDSEELLNEHSKENHWKEIKCEKFQSIKTYSNERQLSSRLTRAHKGQSQALQQSPRPRQASVYMCEVCAKSFSSEATLRYHQRIHTDERPYPCPTCPKRFRLKSHMQVHTNIHTGARPFKCPICPEGFKSHSQKHKHYMLVHTKERPFKCTMCEKTYVISSDLKLHVRTVHLKIPLPPRKRRRKPPAQHPAPAPPLC